MEPLMKLWSLLRVNDIHIGTNKKFTVLFHNTRNTKVNKKRVCNKHQVCFAKIKNFDLIFSARRKCENPSRGDKSREIRPNRNEYRQLNLGT